MIVLDSSVVAALCIDGPGSRAARRAFGSDRERMTSPLWRSEMRSVLLKMVRAGRYKVPAAARVFEGAVRQFRALEVEPDVRLVLDEGRRRRGLSAYDAEYVALARQYGGLVVSADEKLAGLAPEWVVRLSSF